MGETKNERKVLVWLAKCARHGGRSALDFGGAVLVEGRSHSKRKQDNGKHLILAPLARRTYKVHGCAKGAEAWDDRILQSIQVVSAFASSSFQPVEVKFGQVVPPSKHSIR